MRTLFVCAALVLVGCSKKSETEFSANVAPELEMTHPAAGEWRADGPMIASGTFAGLSSVEIDGAPAVLNGSEWTAEIALARGVNVVEVRGEDSTGTAFYERNAVLAGDFGSSSEPVDGGVVARVNRGGLQVVLGMVGDLIDADELSTSVAGTNVYSDSYGILGWNAVEVDADLGWLWFDAPELDATPRNGEVDVEVAIPMLDVWVPVYGQALGIDFDVDAWLWCDDAVITGTMAVDARNGKLVADLYDVDVELQGFDFDTSLLPGSVESWLLVDTVRGALEDMLVEKVTEMLPPMLEDQLSTLELAFETDLMGTPLSVDATFVDATIDTEGLQIVADVNANSPENGTHGAVGPLITPDAKPTPDAYSDFGLTLSDDLLNRFLFELWAAGLLDIGLSSDDGSLEPALLHSLGAHEHASVNVYPVLPPVMVETDGQAQVQLGELEVEILTPGGEHGERVLLAVSVFADVELTVTAGVVELSLGEPQVGMIVRENDWNVRNETLTNALEDAIPVDLLLGLIGDLEFPLPTLGDIVVAQGDVTRDPSGVHSSISLTLR